MRYITNIIITISLSLFLGLLSFIYLLPNHASTPEFVRLLPSINASFNFFSTVFLVLGFLAIKNGNKIRHKKYMLSAFLTSSLFLVSYLVYHYFQGDTAFLGQGVIRQLYFFILISHIILTAFALPLILLSFTYGLLGNFELHKKISRYTFPIWLYVSVTGVLIYIFLRLN